VYVPAVSPEPGRRSLPSAAPLVRLIGFAMAALACVPFLWHALRGSRAYLGFFEDDFFYYVGVADHLVRDGKLSFDGITATNGFHPLWFMIVTALRLVTGGFGAGFFVAMALLISACLAFTAEAVRRFALALGAGPLAAAVLSTWLMLPVTLVGIQGMEVTLATPLLFWFLARVAERRSRRATRSSWARSRRWRCWRGSTWRSSSRWSSPATPCSRARRGATSCAWARGSDWAARRCRSTSAST
jgi:hypothetical protein